MPAVHRARPCSTLEVGRPARKTINAKAWRIAQAEIETILQALRKAFPARLQAKLCCSQQQVGALCGRAAAVGPHLPHGRSWRWPQLTRRPASMAPAAPICELAAGGAEQLDALSSRGALVRNTSIGRSRRARWGAVEPPDRVGQARGSTLFTPASVAPVKRAAQQSRTAGAGVHDDPDGPLGGSTWPPPVPT